VSAAPRPPELDELTSARLFAAAAVLFGHYAPYLRLPEGMGWLLGGYGVSFFFVLSGFILCYRYWDDFAPGVTAPRYRAFFVARVARIYPSYAAALVLITLVFVAIDRLDPRLGVFPPNAIESWLANLLALQTFAPTYATQQNWNSPAWSISTEFGFYAACPIILALLARHARTAGRLWAAFAAAAAFGALMQAVVLWLVFRHGWDRDYWLDIVASRNIVWRIPDFIAGVVAARLLYGGHVPELQRRGTRDALLAASLAVVAFLNAAPWPSDDTAHYILRQFRLDLAYMFPFAGAVAALAAGPTFLSPLLKRPTLVFLGNASYGIYIYHWIPLICIIIATAGGRHLHPAAVAAVVAGVVLFSAASYAWYETPMRRWLRVRFEHAAPRPAVARVPMRPTTSLAGAALWIGLPFLLYLALLRHFGFDAPIRDDYDAILSGVMALRDAASPRQWLGLLLEQHDGHPIALARFAAWAMAAVAGQVDFRLLSLAGNAALLGVLVLAWAELRGRLPGPVFAAAAFVLLQITYHEASLASTPALSSIAVVFFAFASLFFAQRDGRAAEAATLALGAFAAVVHATGLFALPLVAGAWALRGRRVGAIAAVACAVGVWVLHFASTGYARPPGHASVLAAFAHPLDTIQLFLVVLGALVPSPAYAVLVVAFLLAALGWALRRGLWKESPTLVAWLAFIVLAAAAMAAVDVGLGVFRASRHALPSSCLAMIAILAIAAVAPPMATREAFRTAGAGLVACVLVTLACWGAASDYAFRARLMAKGMPATPEVKSDPWFGVIHPDRDRANAILAEADKRGLWKAREQVVMPTAVVVAPKPVQGPPLAGWVETVALEGARLRIAGWSHIPATVPGRTITLAGAGDPVRLALAVRDRGDVAAQARVPALVFSGFVVEADYASAIEASRAAASLCVLSGSPEHDPRRLASSPGCPGT
jgi:peptidoglycan/LPS O-acetylase OafA/YrhL